MKDITFEQLPKAILQLYEKLEVIEKLLLEQKKTPTSTDRIFLKKREIASLLKLSLPTISKLTFTGVLVAYRTPSGQLRYIKDEVEAAILSRKIKTIKDL